MWAWRPEAGVGLPAPGRQGFSAVSRYRCRRRSTACRVGTSARLLRLRRLATTSSGGLLRGLRLLGRRVLDAELAVDVGRVLSGQDVLPSRDHLGLPQLDSDQRRTVVVGYVPDLAAGEANVHQINPCGIPSTMHLVTSVSVVPAARETLTRSHG